MKTGTRVGTDIPRTHRNNLGLCMYRLDFRCFTSKGPMKKWPRDFLDKSVNTNNNVHQLRTKNNV